MALTPDQIAKLPQNIVNMYAYLEEFIIQDIARRISNSGQLTATTEQQLMIAKDLGIDIKEIEEKVADILKKSQKEVDKLFQEAAATSMAPENELYKKARMATFDINDSELQAYITAASLQTKKEFRNITGSLGFATKKNGKIVYSDIAKFYQETVDFANMQVVTGVTTRQQAVKRAVRRMTNS
ncbi:hypothetical protein FDF59_15855 [Clostridium botulinum]|nr:hypothetical protein [Clostridium botulinum]